jgi:hypothetical protein
MVGNIEWVVMWRGYFDVFELGSNLHLTLLGVLVVVETEVAAKMPDHFLSMTVHLHSTSAASSETVDVPAQESS